MKSKPKVHIGDLFESSSETLVNTVNCVGVMGKGIAKTFKQKYPEMFRDYARRCEEGQVYPGEPYYFEDMLGASIINFPTKKHWRSPSKLEDVVHGLDVICENYKTWGIQSVAFPPLGCGNGGLDWADVGPIMYQKLSKLDIPVEIYAPYGTPSTQISVAFLEQSGRQDERLIGLRRKKLVPGWIAILEVVKQLEAEPYASPVGRTIFQKICYVMTQLGVDTEFNFREGSYGPFSPDVKEALGVLANSGAIVEEQLGRMTALRTSKEFEGLKRNFEKEIAHWGKKIEKTTDLFSRIKDTNQAEEISTVIFAVQKLKSERGSSGVAEQELHDFIVQWKKAWDTPEKRSSVASTIRNLEMLDWIKLEYSEGLNGLIEADVA